MSTDRFLERAEFAFSPSVCARVVEAIRHLDEAASEARVQSRTPSFARSLILPGDWVGAARAVVPGATLYAHGGGFFQRNAALAKIMAAELAAATHRPCLALHYRLAPQHRFPAAIEDVIVAYTSLLESGLAARDIVLAGDSAGATLALSALHILNQRGAPVPGALIAISPITDFSFSSPSVETNSGRDVLNPEVLEAIAASYLGEQLRGMAPQSPVFGSFPPACPIFLATGEAEVLRDGIVAMAQRTSGQGVRTMLAVFDAMPHAFYAPDLEPRRVLMAAIAEWLRSGKDRPPG